MSGRVLLVAIALGGCGTVITAVKEAQARREAEERACVAGDAAACVRVADEDLARYRDPQRDAGHPWVLAAAVERYERACTLRLAVACLKLREVVRVRPGDPPSLHGRRACELGLAAGCLAAAEDFARAQPGVALEMARRACELDDSACVAAVGSALQLGDRGAASALAERACVRASPEICAQVATLDLPAAVGARLEERSCRLGAAGACVRAARRLEAAQPEQADALYRLGCRTGDRAACVGLGKLLVAGLGRPLRPGDRSRR
jgi:hypothetical protein